MPRYFFHTEDGACYPDQDGSELKDLKAASSTALQVLAEHLQSLPQDFWAHDCLQVHVVDEAGMRLLTLTVAASFAPALRDRTQIARPE